MTDENKNETEKNEEREKVAPGFEVSARVGGGIVGDRKATRKEIKEGDYTTVINLSND